MRVALYLSVLLVIVFVFAAAELKAQGMPMMRTVDPYNAKIGAEVLVSGENLSDKLVAEVYLGVDGKNTKVDVISQTDKELKFRVPKIKAGPYRVLVLTKGADPAMIEEPVRLVIEE
jgi:hypothetical protein